jgi:hypothetical protein
LQPPERQPGQSQQEEDRSLTVSQGGGGGGGGLGGLGGGGFGLVVSTRLVLLPHHKAPPLVFTDFEFRYGRSLG